jgi:hypothetical protein
MRLYLTAWKDDKLMPEGLSMQSRDDETLMRLRMLLCFCEGLGYEIHFSESPTLANGSQPSGGYVDL